MNKTLIIIIAVLIILLGWTYIKNGQLKDKVDSKESIIKEQNASIEKIKLKSGAIAFEKTRVEADLQSLKDGYGFLEDSLKQMGIKAKNLESALFISQQTSASGTGKIDTIEINTESEVYKASHLSIVEPFFNFSANIKPSGEYLYQYNIFDSLTVVKTSQRKSIFHAYEHKIRVFNANPKTEITGITSLTIKERPYRWAISVTAGYGITNNGLSPFVGIGVSKPLIRFH